MLLYGVWMVKFIGGHLIFLERSTDGILVILTTLLLSVHKLLLSPFCHVAGNFHWNLEDVAKSILCMSMSGPFLTGYTQVLFLGGEKFKFCLWLNEIRTLITPWSLDTKWLVWPRDWCNQWTLSSNSLGSNIWEWGKGVTYWTMYG